MDRAYKEDLELLMSEIVKAGQDAGVIRRDLETASVSECLFILKELSGEGRSKEGGPAGREEQLTINPPLEDGLVRTLSKEKDTTSLVYVFAGTKYIGPRKG